MQVISFTASFYEWESLRIAMTQEVNVSVEDIFKCAEDLNRRIKSIGGYN